MHARSTTRGGADEHRKAQDDGALRRAGDIDGALAFFHPEVEWRIIDAPPPLPERGRGVEPIRVLFEPGDSFPIVVPSPEVDDYIEGGSWVIAVVRDPDIEVEEASVYEFEDGKIVRSTDGYPGRTAALESLGCNEREALAQSSPRGRLAGRFDAR